MASSKRGSGKPSKAARQYNIPGANKDGVKHGVLTPRKRAPEPVTRRYVPTCIGCGMERGKAKGLKCARCEGGDDG
jgi:hypothetical protein